MENAVKNMVKQKVKELPDDLILKILSKLPLFNESVAISLISKHRNEPWKLVQDVTFEDDNEESLVTFMSFVYGSLLSDDDDQTLERLHLKLNRKYSASDINFWVQVAVNRFVRKLRLDRDHGPLRLPRCLSNSTTLKSLILRNVTINHVPRGFCLPSLKSLHLFSVHFSQKASISRLLQSCPDLEYLVLQKYSWYYLMAEVRFCLSSLKSLHILSAIHDTCLTPLLQSCPVLENLVVTQNKSDFNPIFGVIPPASRLPSIKSLHLSSVEHSVDESVTTLLKRSAAFDDFVISRTRHYNGKLSSIINVPTLKSLTINNTEERLFYGCNENHGFWINAPALQTLNIKDTVSNFLVLEFMPEVTKENIEAALSFPVLNI